jgi:hypothetical protein
MALPAWAGTKGFFNALNCYQLTSIRMNKKSKKYLFNLVGGGIVIIWLIMIGVLIKKVSFNNNGEKTDFVSKKPAAVSSRQQDWMEIYLKGKKVGYSVNQTSPAGEDYLIQEEIFLRLNLMGQASNIHTITRALVDHEFLLINFRFRMSSGVVTFQASGRVEGNQMVLEVGEGAGRRGESITLPEPPVIGSGMAQFFKGQLIKVGQSFKFPVFDPSTFTQKQMVIRVKARETITISGIKYETFRLESEMWGQPTTFWLDQRGVVLKEEGFMGLTLVKSNPARAPRDIEGSGGSDFYRLAAIKLNRRLPHADRLRYLKLRAEGLDKAHFDTHILNSGRQRLRGGIIEIVQENSPLHATYTLPYSGQSGKIIPFLQPELNVESDHRAITERAHEIIGDAKNPFTAARQLMDWVYCHVEKRPVISVPSALEVLKSRVGDCNEHAVLLTALLRAAGIPARLCVGLVYAKEGFFYHAWIESWVGEWISMDPILNQMPVDATHIKLVHGGLDKQVEILGLIGKLRLEIIDYHE